MANQGSVGRQRAAHGTLYIAPAAACDGGDIRMTKTPRVTFGIIVLNGEPFTRYCLRALYPFAHEIIVVEGAAPAAHCIAREDGHSSDGTLDVLHTFAETEDPEQKITIVTAEDEGHPDGFWPGEKHEQSQAYAHRATGDYLWQVDIDEFYQPADMQNVFEMLRDDPTITAVSFKQITFWGGFDYCCDSWYLRRGNHYYHRLFRWGAAYEYVTHRPPTVHDPQGRDLRTLHWIDGKTLERRSILLYHYSLLFPKQVLEKCAYYDQASWVTNNRYREWADDSFLNLRRPYRVHNVYNYPSWLERFRATAPPQIEAMRRDIEGGALPIEKRRTDDIERLLRSPRYALGRTALRVLERPERWWRRFRRQFSHRMAQPAIARA
jgi:hypothetical protein